MAARPSPSSRSGYRERIAAGRRARLRSLRRVGIGIALAVAVAAVVGPFLLRSSSALPGGGSGLAVWSDRSSVPVDASWDGSSLTTADPMAAMGSRFRVMQGAASPTRDEAIVIGVVDNSNEVRTQIWNGTAWSEPAFSPMNAVSDSFWWGFDVAYESQSGDAVVVWNNGNGGTQGVSYRVWDGSSWSATTGTISAPVSGEAKQMQLAASPTSDEMVLVVSTGSSHDWAAVWNGSGWVDAIDLSGSGSGDLTDVNVAYEQQSGDALVVWGESAADLRYRVYDGTWGGEQPVPSPVGDAPRWTAIGADPTGDRIAVGVSTFGNRDIWLAVWNGSAWGSVTTASTGSPVDVFPGVAVAFEGSSGDALAVYAETTNAVRYRTWNGSWGAEQSGPDPNHNPNSMTLSGRQSGDQIMLAVQDASSDLSYAEWDGGSWGTITQVEDDTGEVKNQPFLFLWQPPSQPPALAPIADRSNAEGSAVSFAASATDPDGDPLTWSATGLPPGVVIDPATGSISGTIRYAAAYGSPYTVEVTVTDPSAQTDRDTFTWTVTGSEGMVLATRDDIGSPITARNGDALWFGGPTLAWEPAGTTGEFGLLSAFEDLGVRDLAGVHLVTRDITIGSSPGIDLEVGDLLFTTRDDDTLVSTNTISVSKNDVVRFRPDVAGDYRSGTFLLLLDNPLGAEIRGLSLAESGTLVGDVPVAAGSFVLSRAGGAEDSDIWLFRPTGVGEATTAGLTSILLGEAETGIDAQVHGVDLVETDRGGVLAAGAVLVTLDAADQVGSAESLSVDQGDVVALYAAGSGPATTTAALVFDASEAGLSVRINAIDLPLRNLPPTFDQDGGDRIDLEGAAISLTNAATDPEGDPLTWSASGLPPGLSIESATGTVSGTIASSAAAGSPYAVALRVQDPSGGFDLDTFTWTITESNRAPSVVNPGNRTSNENQAITFAMSGSDPDDDPLTWSASGLPDGLGIAPASGVISGTLTYSSSGVYLVTVRATDPGALFDEVTFTWTVDNVNRGPNVDHPGHQTVAEGEVFSLVVTATDPDGDGFTWSATNLPTGLSIDPITGEISGTVAFGAATLSPFNSTIRATDDGSPQASGAALVDWTIAATNRPPDVANPGDQSDTEGDPITLPIAGNDPDGDTITWSASGLPDGLSINSSSGVISGTPSSASAGVHAVTVTATDDGAPVEATQVAFTWTVGDFNRPPSVTSPGDQNDAESDAVTLAVAGSDPDGDGLTWSAAGLPPGLSIDPGSGEIAGTLTFTASGLYPVTVRATDDGAGNLFDEVAFTWTVADTNRPPVVTNPGDLTTSEGDMVELAVAALDPDGDGFTWSATGLPSGLTIDPVTGAITGDVAYTAAGWSPYSVTVTATDDGSPAEAGQAVFTWTISDVNLAPTIGDPGSQASPVGGSVVLAMTAADPEGGAIAWSASGLPSGLAIDPVTGVIGGSITAPAGTVTTATVIATDDGTPAASGVVQFKWAITGDLTIAKTSDAGGAAAIGDVITYTITVGNPGPALHTGVSISDPLPAGTTFVSARVTYPVDGGTGTLSDGWETEDYSGSTGTIPWSGPWVETGDDGDPGSGDIHLHKHDGVWQLEMEKGGKWITRGADLSSYLSAEVSYRFRRHGLRDVDDVVVVEVSADGTDWTEIARHAGPGDDEWQVKAPIDVSDFLSAGFAIRFRSLPTHKDGELRIDWVEITAQERSDQTISAGPPPALATGITLRPGESATVEMVVRVDDPLDRSILSIDNTATVTSDVQVVDAVDSTSDAVNHGPLFDQDRVDRTDAEGDPISLANGATDPNGDALTWSATGLPGGLAVDPATGEIAGTIGYEAAASSPFTVTLRVEDPAGDFDTDTFSWVVTDTNRPPTVTDPGDQSGAEGDPSLLLISGTDPDGDGLTWSATGLPDGLAIDPATGVVSGTFGYDAAGSSPHAVTVRATDDGSPSLYDEVTFSWTVTDTNRAPVVTSPGDQADAEGDAITLSIAGSDPDGDGLIWSATGLPDGLSIDAATGEIGGTLSYGAAGTHAVALRATDDGSPARFTEAAFTWTVADTNRPPVIDPVADQSDAEGGAVSVALSGSDPDGDGLTWTANSLPPGLMIGGSTGVISGTITYDASGTYTVTVRLTDDRIPGLSDEQTFLWSIAEVNRAPEVGAPADRTDAEGDSITLSIGGSDPDGDALTWSATGLPPGLEIAPATGTISGTITYDASPASPYAVTVRVTDDGSPARFTEAAFTWTVLDTNRAPVVTDPGSRASGEGDVIFLEIPATDPDGDRLTWSAAGLPEGLSISPATGVISGTVSFGASTGSPFTVAVTVADDGDPALSTTVAFPWTIADTNRAPQVTAVADQFSAEGDTISLPMAGSDPDGDGLTWSATGLPEGLSISSATGVISGTVSFEAADGSPAVVLVTATDDGVPALWTTVSFTWTVADVNRAPSIADPADRSSAEGAAVSVALAASDPDGDRLTWSAAGLPQGLAIDPATGVISGAADFESSAASPFSVTVRVVDDRSPNLSDAATFTWTVTDTNRAPLVEDPGDRTGEEGGQASLAISGTDPDGDRLTWSATGLPPGLRIDAGSGSITGRLETPGVFTVTVTATDDGDPSLSASVGFTWTVTAFVPSGPVIEPLPDRSDLVGEQIEIRPAAQSPDGEVLTWSAVGLPDGITIDPETGRIDGTLVTPGVYEVVVTVTDTRGLTAGAGFTWTVGEGLPVDEPPRAEDDVLRLVETGLDDGVIVLRVLLNDRDPEGGPLRVVRLGEVPVGEAWIADGTEVVFRPPAGWLGTTGFSYVVADEAGNTDTARIEVTITPDLDERAAGGTLRWQTPTGSRATSVVGVLGTPETELVLGSIVQSLHVLRMPLTLLGAAVLWSLLLGGAFNLTLLLRGGLPILTRGARQALAIVLARHGQKIPAHADPGEGEVIHRFLATDKGIGGTGKVHEVDGVRWARVDTPAGRGWVEAVHLTEYLDAETFADDPAPAELLADFADVLRSGGDLTPFVSQHGLWVSHHDSPVHYPPERIAGLLDSRQTRLWLGRNPAFPDVEGTFREMVADGFLEAWDHPERVLGVDRPSVPSTVVPVEYTNFHVLSVGADLTGRERLDQTAWLAHFSYEQGVPYLIALTREG